MITSGSTVAEKSIFMSATVSSSAISVVASSSS